MGRYAIHAVRVVMAVSLMVFGGVGVQAQVPSYVPQNGLVGWWPFNGNAIDESGKGNNGQVNGAVPTTDRFGAPNKAYQFNGGQNIALNNIQFQNYVNSGFTLSYWFTLTDTAVQPASLFANYDGVNGLQIETSYNVAEKKAYLRHSLRTNSRNPPEINGGTSYIFSPSNWNHAIMVWAPPFMKTYLNGRLIDSLNGSGLNNFSVCCSYVTRIGSRSNGTQAPHIGKIDDVALWNRAISNQEALQLNQLNCTITSFDPFPASIYSRLDSLALNAGSGYAGYAWSTSQTSQTIQVKNTGGYRVTVTNAQGCTGTDSVFVQFPDTIGLHVSTVQGICNQTVDVPVRVTAFRNMLTMQGSLNWDAKDLRFEGISGFGPTSLGMNEGNFGVSQAANGRITFSWNDPSSAGVSLADSTTVFTLRFTSLGTTRRTVPITITGTPTPLEFYDAGLVRKSQTLTAGGVNIICEFTITGKVLTPVDKGVRNVTVTLTGGTSPRTAVTDSAGNYSFKVLPGTYTITPTKTYEQNKTNGVSTVDIALMQAHILLRVPFNAAYKLIASDANNNASVTTADILFLRRLILGTDTTLPTNRIWAFVDGEQTFAAPSAAFPFNSTKTLTNQSTDVSHTFRAIKIGDVNYDRNPQLDEGPAGDTLRLFYTWTDTDNGEVLLNLRSKSFEGLMGWQGTLRWDARKLELLAVTPMMPNLGTGDRWKGEGSLTLSWNDPRAEGLSLTDGVEWLQLRFRKTERLDRTALGLTQERLMTEAFNKSYQRVELRMQAAEIRGNAWEGSMRVYPNPAQRMVNVEWKSAKRGEATIRLMDATGRTVHVHRAIYEAGVQKHVIRRDGSMASGGICLVQVEVDGEVRNRSVVMAGQEP
jgi:hypothetical protein